MRKIIVSTDMTLDGVIENPQNWSFNHWSDELTQHAKDLLWASDALLLGRETYQAFVAAWPSRTDEFSDRINKLPKHVASRTLKEMAWNATLLKGDDAKELSRLKQQPGQDILMYGCGGLAYTLAQHGLIDEYQIKVFPVAVGNGKRLFHDKGKVGLKLINSKTFSTGVVVHTYQPA